MKKLLLPLLLIAVSGLAAEPPPNQSSNVKKIVVRQAATNTNPKLVLWQTGQKLVDVDTGRVRWAGPEIF